MSTDTLQKLIGECESALESVDRELTANRETFVKHRALFLQAACLLDELMPCEAALLCQDELIAAANSIRD